MSQTSVPQTHGNGEPSPGAPQGMAEPFPGRVLTLTVDRKSPPLHMLGLKLRLPGLLGNIFTF